MADKVLQKNITVKSIFKALFMGSKCANTEEIKQMLVYLEEKQVYKTVLEYRGSEHGWYRDDFHERVDHKDWTITLFKIKDGDCVGGFTTQSWHHRAGSITNCRVRDDNAFLFNLSCAR
jgi:hypothetical protein